MPISSLGLLVAATMIACLVCDTVLLPVLLTAKKPAFARCLPRVTTWTKTTQAVDFDTLTTVATKSEVIDALVAALPQGILK
jgi:hypothetical protein